MQNRFPPQCTAYILVVIIITIINTIITMITFMVIMVMVVLMKVLITTLWAGSHQLPVGPSEKGFGPHQGEYFIHTI